MGLVSRPTVETVPNTVVDVIVVVDNSGSMMEEAAQVRAGINRLAATLATSGLDYRVVMISQFGEAGIAVCVPPPLGAGAPTCGTGPEGRLRHVNQIVGSNDALGVFRATYPAFQDFLRPGSLRAFLWITDDEALDFALPPPYASSPDAFRASLDGLDPDGVFGPTVHHAIVGYFGEEPGTWSDPSAGACGTIAAVGRTYLSLARCRADDGTEIPDCASGAIARVCDTDWTETFVEIARSTESAAILAPVACTLAPPAAPEGRVLDYSRLRVTYRSGAESTLVPRASAGRCSGGWRFDDETSPGAIVLCPDVCRRVQTDPAAEIELTVACYDDPS